MKWTNDQRNWNEKMDSCKDYVAWRSSKMINNPLTPFSVSPLLVVIRVTMGNNRTTRTTSVPRPFRGLTRFAPRRVTIAKSVICAIYFATWATAEIHYPLLRGVANCRIECNASFDSWDVYMLAPFALCNYYTDCTIGIMKYLGIFFWLLRLVNSWIFEFILSRCRCSVTRV